MIKMIIILFPIILSKKKWLKSNFSLSMMFILSLLFLYNPGLKLNFSSNSFMLNKYSAILISLSIWIFIMMVISSQILIKNSKKNNMFIMLILWLMASIIFLFSTKNMMMFYVFFEMTLIPTSLIILIWGYQPERLQASLYLMIYMVIASLPLLISLISLTNINNSYLFINLQMYMFPQDLMIFPMMLAFLVKSPMFFIHLWLPKAHVEAPTAGSMILAAILLKLGGYGMVMFMSSINFSVLNKLIILFALMGGIMASMICMVQTDMKSFIAYSSINHMSLMIMGLMSFYSLAWKMSLMIMIAHGLISSGLFMLSGFMFIKTSTRSIFLSKLTIQLSPTLSLIWFLMIMGNMSAPPSINLISEIFLINSFLSMSDTLILISFLMVFLSGLYNLYLYSTLNHGQINLKSSKMNIFMKNFSLLSFLQFSPIIMLMLSMNIMI